MMIGSSYKKKDNGGAMCNKLNFAGKRILINGASSGMGAASAKLLSELGAKVVLIARREERLKEVMASLEGEGHAYYVYDLSNVEGIETLMKQIISEQGSMDGFVHSAGMGVARPLKMSNYKFMLEVMNVNYFSFVEQIRCLMKRGASNPGFSIVGISSSAAVKGGKAHTAYASSKSAMDTTVKVLAKELGVHGVRINSILPGYIDTELGRRSVESDPTRLDGVLRVQVLGLGYAEDVADAVAFLLSDMARIISGETMYVDGAYMA